MRREEEKELPQRFIPFFDPRDYEVPENLSGSEIYPISSVNFRPILRNQMIQIYFSQNIYNYVFKVYNEQERIFHVPQAFFFLYSQLQERWRYSGRINTDFYSNRNLYTLYIRGVCVYLISNMIILEL